MALTQESERLTPPILIYDGGDFMFFQNIHDTGRFLEPGNIQVDETLVFDASQRVLKFAVQKGKWFDKVVFTGIDEKKCDLDLRYLLAKYLVRHTGDKSYLDASWDSLISYVIEYLLPSK